MVRGQREESAARDNTRSRTTVIHLKPSHLRRLAMPLRRQAKTLRDARRRAVQTARACTTCSYSNPAGYGRANKASNRNSASRLGATGARSNQPRNLPSLARGLRVGMFWSSASSYRLDAAAAPSQVSKSGDGEEPVRRRRYESIEADVALVAKHVRRAWHAVPPRNRGKRCRTERRQRLPG